ncbi:MAG: enoyl-CoA hydratase/isomerase family protein [Bacteroidetes bacterium]|nr:MAG: enoyl-CoA hydratase/isomerase family protein [Bacteroidota bacterium]
MVAEFRETFRALETDETVGGVLLTGIPHFFSAGLDVIELYDYDRETIRQFFIDFGTMHVELANFPKPLVCAITGHSPAGGTVIAVAADYRVMADNPKYTIGLNEVAVNIQISQNLVDAYAFWVGTGKAHELVMEGKLMSPTEAKACGLVQEICPLEETEARAEQKLRHYLMAHPGILRNTKAKLRQSWLARVNARDGADELAQAIDIWWRPEVRARMKAFIDRLQKKV